MKEVDNSQLQPHPLRCSSLPISRSRSRTSSVLSNDSIPFESARFTRYERLSHSMRLDLDADSSLTFRISKDKKTRNKAWVLISRVFSFRRSNASDDILKYDDHHGDVIKPVKPRRSTWLPDPNRRWPVQGW
ncbi:hypothetical protein vseg_005285 [Gypsophila vaccaria]